MPAELGESPMPEDVSASPTPPATETPPEPTSEPAARGTPEQDATNSVESLTEPMTDEATPTEPKEASPEQPQAASSEMNSPSEVSRERQSKELGIITSSILNRKWQGVKAKLNADEDLTEQERALQGHDGTAAFLAGNTDVTELSFMQGNPVMLLHEGQEYRVVKAVRDPDGTIRAGLQAPGTNFTSYATVSAEALLFANAQSVMGELSGLLTEPEQKALALTIQLKTGHEPSLEPTEIDAVIEAAGRSMGATTPDMIRKLMEATKTPAEVVERVNSAMSGKNIIDSDSVAVVLKESGLTQASLATMKNSQEAILAELEGKLMSNPEDKNIQKAYEQAGIILTAYDRFLTGDEIPNYFKALEEGRIDPALTEKVWQGIASGKIDTVLQKTISELEDKEGDSEEVKKDKADKRAIMQSAVGASGIGAAFMLLAVWGVYSSVGKVIK